MAAVLLALLPFILAEAGLRLFGVGRPVALAAVLLRGVLFGFVFLVLMGLDWRFALVVVACEVLIVPRLPAIQRHLWGLPEGHAR